MQVGGRRRTDATGRCRCRCCRRRFSRRFPFAASRRRERKVRPPLVPQARQASGSFMSEPPPLPLPLPSPPTCYALSSGVAATPDQPFPSSPPDQVTPHPHPQAPEVDEEEEEEGEGEKEEEEEEEEEQEEEEQEEEGSWKEKFDDNMSINSLNDSGARTPLCRICFQGPEQGELLSPCRCSGSVRCSHEPCLVKWISERGSWSCEICYYKYHVVSISNKNPLQWRSITLTVIERVQIAAAVLGSLFLLASISWLVWSTLSPNARWQRQDLLFQICYAMYGFMDLVCIVLIVHEGPSVFRIFHRWQAVNQRWKVLNYDKVTEPAPSGSRSGSRSGSGSSLLHRCCSRGAWDLAEQQKPDSGPRRHPPLPDPGARTGRPHVPPPASDRTTGGSPSSSALLAAVAMTMTPAHPGVTSSPDREEEEEEEEREDAVAAEASPTTTDVTSGSGERSVASPGLGENRDGTGGGGYCWTYSLLHLLGQRGGPGPQARSPSPPPQNRPPGPRNANRELVMRVTSL
ncbi:E3 ubiquitin-protein ligase MARCH4 [Merluccius polli]|uniref:RING-type E3 ubiquitin transferase n=1 Tax=Merluccius polli TaxID=89951 RepID=A0AA47N6P3_MERPO|nr:E3 ubiquitin-protein ligase MARCH4 [Merluccius polli]